MPGHPVVEAIEQGAGPHSSEQGDQRPDAAELPDDVKNGGGAEEEPSVGRKNRQAVRERAMDQPLEGDSSQGGESDAAFPVAPGHEGHGGVAQAAAAVVEQARQPFTSTHSPTAMKAQPAAHLMALSGM